MKRFLNLVVYILTIHVSALLIAGLFRLVLFISSLIPQHYNLTLFISS